MRRQTFLNGLLSIMTLVFTSKILRSEEVKISKEGFLSELDNAKSLNEITQFLSKLPTDEKLYKIEGSWKIAKVLNHCSQSITYSIHGYPEMKSSFFQNTIGTLAFSFFSLRGKMSHGLEEPIPGSSALNEEDSLEDSIKTLVLAIAIFEKATSEELKPHFAYGKLDKEDYDYAHTLHIKNHFQRINLI